MNWNIFPPRRAYPYAPGDQVCVKSKDTKVRYWRGKVISVDDRTGIHVQPQHGDNPPPSTVKNPNKLIPLFCRKEPTIIVTGESSYFRQQSCQVNEHDTVLEIGCCNGETSKLLIPRAKHWIGFDTSDAFIEECRQFMKDYPHSTHIAKVDALVHPGKAVDEATKFGSRPNVVFLDIGGNRECYNVLRMLSWCRERLGDNLELVVIKSRELVQTLLSTAQVDRVTGAVDDGDEWLKHHRVRRVLPKHPLRAPRAMTPDGTKEICRYHNYHNDGCTLPECPLDHDHCPACFGRDHIARDCSLFRD